MPSIIDINGAYLRNDIVTYAPRPNPLAIYPVVVADLFNTRHSQVIIYVGIMNYISLRE